MKPAELDRELLSSFCPAARKDVTSAWGALPRKETVGPSPFFLFRVIGKRHCLDATMNFCKSKFIETIKSILKTVMHKESTEG